MVDGVFDNLTVNLLSKLKGMVHIAGSDLLVDSGTGGIIIRHESSGDGWGFYTTEGGSTLLLMKSPSKGNTESRVAFDAGGNVGIGTESPSEKLTIQGDKSAPYALNVGGTSNARIKVRHLDGKDFQSGNLDNLYLQYGVKHHTILNAGGSDGNVGIGTTDPKQKLTLGSGNILLPNTNLGIDGNLYFGGVTSSGQTGMRLFGGMVNNSIPAGFIDVRTTDPRDGLRIRVDTTFGGTERMRITANGNVGIGTTNPATTLDVNGNVNVAGDISLSGADCAEEFDVAEIEKIDSGTVLVIGDESKLQPCKEPYDKKVAGVVSGGSGTNPGIILGKSATQNKRLPIALNGKVYCKVDAQYSSIEVGDLLTTSYTDGHAMKADDPLKAFGAVIGKAICPLREGTGLIPILVALQ